MTRKELQEKGITPIGVTNWRNENKLFGIKDKDRLGHIYCIGKTGVGKSTLLMNMAISDIERGNGLCVIDPHGDIATNLLNYIPDMATIINYDAFSAAEKIVKIAFERDDTDDVTAITIKVH